MPSKKDSVNQEPQAPPQEQPQQGQPPQPTQQVPPFLMRMAQNIARKRGITIDEALNLIAEYFTPSNEPGPVTKQASDLTGAILEYVKARTLLSDMGNGDGKFEAVMADVKTTVATSLQQLQAQIDDLRKALSEVVNNQKALTEEKVLNVVKEEVNKQLSPVREVLDKLSKYIEEDVQRKSQEQINELLKPILDKLSEIEARVSTVEVKEKEVAGIKDQVGQLKALLNEAKEALESLGYRVEGSRPVTPDELQRVIQQTLESLSPEQIKAIAERKGLMVVDTKVPITEVTRMVEEAKQKAYQEALASNFMNNLKDVIDTVMGVAERIIPRVAGPPIRNALESYAQRQAQALARPRIQVEDVTQQVAQQVTQQVSQQAQSISQQIAKSVSESTAVGGGQ